MKVTSKTIESVTVDSTKINSDNIQSITTPSHTVKLLTAAKALIVIKFNNCFSIVSHDKSVAIDNMVIKFKGDEANSKSTENNATFETTDDQGLCLILGDSSDII